MSLKSRSENGEGIKPDGDNMDKPNYMELSYLLQLGSNLLPSNHLSLSPRWQSWFVRGQSGVLLISCFYTIVMLGPPGLLCLTYIVQLASYQEVMGLGQQITKVEGLSNWCWQLLIVANIYFSHPAVHFLLPFSPAYIPLISYVLYIIGSQVCALHQIYLSVPYSLLSVCLGSHGYLVSDSAGTSSQQDPETWYGLVYIQHVHHYHQ